MQQKRSPSTLEDHKTKIPDIGVLRGHRRRRVFALVAKNALFFRVMEFENQIANSIPPACPLRLAKSILKLCTKLLLLS